MDYLEETQNIFLSIMEWANKIDIGDVQYGVDIATSITIIGSVFIFIINSRKEKKKAREISIHESTRSTLLDKTLNLLESQSKIYSATVASFNTASMATNDYAYNEMEADSRQAFFRNVFSPEGLIKNNKEIELLKSNIGNFANESKFSKYSLYPLIDSFSSGNESLKHAVIDTGSVIEKILLANGGVNILKDIEKINSLILPIQEVIFNALNNKKSNSELMELLKADPKHDKIVQDVRFIVTKWFVTQGAKPFMSAYIDLLCQASNVQEGRPLEEASENATYLIDSIYNAKMEDAVELEVVKNFVESFTFNFILNDEYDFIIEVHRELMRMFYEALVECNKTLFSLSAISRKIIDSSNDESLDSITKRYSDEFSKGADVDVFETAFKGRSRK